MATFNFGRTANGASSFGNSADAKTVSSATPTANGVVVSATARLWVGSGSTVARAIIYSNNAGQPDTLLATSDEITISETTETAKTFNFSGANQITLYAGTTYWIGVHWQDPGASINIYVSRANTATSRKDSNDTYSGGAANPFGSVTDANGPIDCHVTCNYAKWETFSDNFDDNSLSARWSPWVAGDYVETNQQLQITSTTAASYKGGSVSGMQDLTGSYVFMEVPHVLTGLTDGGTYMQFNIDASNTITFFVKDGTLYVEKQIAGTYTSVANTAYNSSTHRWWKIRESGGNIYCDYSSDGTSWINFTSFANPFAVTALNFSIFIGTDSANAGTDTIQVDNLNVVPSVPTAVKDMLGGIIPFAR